MKLTRKLLALALVLCMVCSLSITAFAAEDPTYKDQATVTIKKVYKATNTGTTSPAEEFKFTIEATDVSDAAEGVTTATMPVPTIASVSFDAGDATTQGATGDIVVTLPTNYTSVGIYTYTIKETKGTTAGVTYREDPITLKVTVIEQDGQKRVAAVHTENPLDVNNAQGKKSDTIENVYAAGSLAVTKNVTGNLGDKDKAFDVKVTFNAPSSKTVKEAISYVVGTETKTIATNAWTNGKAEVTISLTDGDTVTFTNIPYDVTYDVAENDYTEEGYDEAKHDFSDAAKKIDSASDTVTITNNKDGEIDTGIVLDSMPYILTLALAVIGGAALVMKKRYSI